ncbi:helix-turn-helix domain-containing protein [Ancrocorticia sp.]|uniref:helix-turn-helix domain-containing protein n=1 Tax=Ancrocorticia sp. TaxID=2593684 RepID=UPI003F90C1B1
MSQSIETGYLNYEQASDYTGLSQRTLRRLVARGDLKAYKFPGVKNVLIDPKDIKRALKPVTPLAEHNAMARAIAGDAA